MTKYRVRMRGKELLIEPEGRSEPMVFVKSNKHTGLFEQPADKKDDKDKDKKEKKGH